MTGTRLMDTRDVDEARQLVGSEYCPHRLSLTGDAQAFHAVQTEWRVGEVKVHRLGYGAELTVEAEALRTSVLVTSPLRGHLTVSSVGVEHHYGAGQVVALGPDTPFALRWEGGCELRTVQVDRALLETEGGRDTPVDGALDPQHCATPAQTATWHRLTMLLQAHADDDATGQLLLANLESLVASTVLSHHGRRGDDRVGDAVTPRQLRRAIEFVETHAAEPLTAGDIAAAAHLSIRSLQVGLRRYFGTTPTELLRAARLTRAHLDLVEADPTRCTVADIAYRWGFGNPGRFSRYYAERYGVPPSDTLRR